VGISRSRPAARHAADGLRGSRGGRPSAWLQIIRIGVQVHASMSDLIRVAAAPDPSVHELRFASPELALVDASLAAELRLGLNLPEDSLLRPGRVFGEVLATLPTPEKLLETILDDGLADPGSDVRGDAAEVVGLLDDEVSDYRGHSSLCPALPAPEPGDEDAFDATDAALRRIRENFTVEPQETRRRFRRGFTAASGASALCASLVLVADVQFGVAQLSAWLHF
jgi:hypothetical protein